MSEERKLNRCVRCWYKKRHSFRQKGHNYVYSIGALSGVNKDVIFNTIQKD